MKNVKLVIERAQGQDQKAFNDLFNYHWGYLYNFQLKKTGNKDLAEEISIITFARAFDRISTFNDKFEFKTWLLTISKNIYNDLLRKENNKKNPTTLFYPTDLQEFVTENHPSPEEVLITNQDLESLLNKIKSLKQELLLDKLKIIILSLFPFFLIMGTAISEIGVIVLCIIFILEYFFKNENIFNNKLIYFFLCLYTCLIINLIFSLNIDNSILRNLFFPKYIIFVLGIINFLPKKNIGLLLFLNLG